ncbi:MAG: HlyD family efflux transporter periplasmic adaptor subunit [Proteobacteria bacterium]|nr:HlyD family efflux transporter periplasmic adaptor subunit [Pseudomonadota bacterium]
MVQTASATRPQFRPGLARIADGPVPDPAAHAASGATPHAAAAADSAAAAFASAQLIRIEGDLRRCATRDALWHHLANEPVVLLPFGQAVVFEAHRAGSAVRPRWWPASRRPFDDRSWKAVAISALTRVNRDAPMVRWYENIVRTLWSLGEAERGMQAFELPALADPEDPCTTDAALRHLLWVPLSDAGQPVKGGWLLARSAPWEDAHHKLAARLAAAYAHGLSAIEGRAKPPPAWRRHQSKLALAAVAVAAALVFVRVPLTTLAPVEVTPQDPFVVAAPVAGVVERILVAPGAQVRVDEALVQLVDTSLRSDFEVADQKLEVARAKTLRLQQASVEDATAKRELAIAQTEQSVAVAEREYARAMLDKSVIRARQGGVALYGDPRDWAGRPVAVGEAIMRVADPAHVEFQIKVPVADAVNLHEGARVKVFLDASPLEPVEANVLRAAYKAEADAAGVASYTVTARLANPDAPAERLGLRGTARVYGEPVSLLYYLLRRPITAVRQWTGI